MFVTVEILFGLLATEGVAAWVLPGPATRRTPTTRPPPRTICSHRGMTRLDMAAVGIFYGTTQDDTKEVADKIYNALGSDIAAPPVDIRTIPRGKIKDALRAHDALILGTPTGRPEKLTERSGTLWDDLCYGSLPWMRSELENKRVAVFGLGDQVSSPFNFADAAGELYDVFDGLDCEMMGATSQEGYRHESSRSVRGTKFCGLLVDTANQRDLTDERVQKWIEQLFDEGLYGEPSDNDEPNNRPQDFVDVVPFSVVDQLRQEAGMPNVTPINRGGASSSYPVNGGSTGSDYPVNGESSKPSYPDDLVPFSVVDQLREEAGMPNVTPVNRGGPVNGGSTGTSFPVNGDSSKSKYPVNGDSSKSNYPVNGDSAAQRYPVNGEVNGSGSTNSPSSGYRYSATSGPSAENFPPGPASSSGTRVPFSVVDELSGIEPSRQTSFPTNGSGWDGISTDYANGSGSTGYSVNGDSTASSYPANGDSTSAYQVNGDSAVAGYPANGDSTSSYSVNGDSTVSSFPTNGDSGASSYQANGDSSSSFYPTNGDASSSMSSANGDSTVPSYPTNGDISQQVANAYGTLSSIPSKSEGTNGSTGEYTYSSTTSVPSSGGSTPNEPTDSLDSPSSVSSSTRLPDRSKAEGKTPSEGSAPGAPNYSRDSSGSVSASTKLPNRGETEIKDSKDGVASPANSDSVDGYTYSASMPSGKSRGSSFDDPDQTSTVEVDGDFERTASVDSTDSAGFQSGSSTSSRSGYRYSASSVAANGGSSAPKSSVESASDPVLDSVPSDGGAAGESRDGDISSFIEADFASDSSNGETGSDDGSYSVSSSTSGTIESTPESWIDSLSPSSASEGSTPRSWSDSLSSASVSSSTDSTPRSWSDSLSSSSTSQPAADSTPMSWSDSLSSSRAPASTDSTPKSWSDSLSSSSSPASTDSTPKSWSDSLSSSSAPASTDSTPKSWSDSLSSSSAPASTDSTPKSWSDSLSSSSAPAPTSWSDSLGSASSKTSDATPKPWSDGAKAPTEGTVSGQGGSSSSFGDSKASFSNPFRKSPTVGKSDVSVLRGNGAEKINKENKKAHTAGPQTKRGTSTKAKDDGSEPTSKPSSPFDALLRGYQGLANRGKNSDSEKRDRKGTSKLASDRSTREKKEKVSQSYYAVPVEPATTNPEEMASPALGAQTYDDANQPFFGAPKPSYQGAVQKSSVARGDGFSPRSFTPIKDTLDDNSVSANDDDDGESGGAVGLTVSLLKTIAVGAIIGAWGVTPLTALHHLFIFPSYQGLAKWEFDTTTALFQGAMFALTYRYAMGKELDNAFKRNTVLSAFVLVRSVVRVSIPMSCTALPLMCGEPFDVLNYEMLQELGINSAESLALFGAVVFFMDYYLRSGWIKKH